MHSIPRARRVLHYRTMEVGRKKDGSNILPLTMGEEHRERRVRKYLERRLLISRKGFCLPLPNPRGVPDSPYEKFVKLYEHIYNAHCKGEFSFLRPYFSPDASFITKRYEHDKALPDAKNPFGTFEVLQFSDFSAFFSALEAFQDLAPDCVIEFTSYKVRERDNFVVFRAKYRVKATILATVPVPKGRFVDSIEKMMEYSLPPPGKEAHQVDVTVEQANEVRQLVFDADLYDATKNPDKVTRLNSGFESQPLDGEKEMKLIAMPVRCEGYLLLYVQRDDNCIKRAEFNYYESGDF